MPFYAVSIQNELMFRDGITPANTRRRNTTTRSKPSATRSSNTASRPKSSDPKASASATSATPISMRSVTSGAASAHPARQPSTVSELNKKIYTQYNGRRRS